MFSAVYIVVGIFCLLEGLEAIEESAEAYVRYNFAPQYWTLKMVLLVEAVMAILLILLWPLAVVDRVNK